MLPFFGFCPLKTTPLSLCPDKIMVGILYFIIGVTINIIGKETHRLHIREKHSRVWQALNLYWKQEVSCTLKITFCKSLEDSHIEVNVFQALVVFIAGIRRRP